MRPTLSIRGFHIYKTALDIGAQRQLVEAVRGIVKAAPLMRPQTPSGRQMSVRMTSAGRVGWTATASGYQYATCHPSGVAWPAIPREILDVWSKVTRDAPFPDSCLINFYDEAARMGLHRDHDEADFQWPLFPSLWGMRACCVLAALSVGAIRKASGCNQGILL